MRRFTAPVPPRPGVALPAGAPAPHSPVRGKTPAFQCESEPSGLTGETPPRPCQPRNAHSLAYAQARDTNAQGDDPADDLVTEDQRQLRIGQFAVEHVQIGAAHRASRDTHQHLPRTWPWLGHVPQAQRLTGLLHHHGAHIDQENAQVLVWSADAVEQLRWAASHLMKDPSLADIPVRPKQELILKDFRESYPVSLVRQILMLRPGTTATRTSSESSSDCLVSASVLIVAAYCLPSLGRRATLARLKPVSGSIPTLASSLRPPQRGGRRLPRRSSKSEGGLRLGKPVSRLTSRRGLDAVCQALWGRWNDARVSLRLHSRIQH